MSINDDANAARGVTGSALSNKEILLGVLRLSPEVRTKACADMDQILKDFVVPFPVAYQIIRNRFDAVAAKYQLDSAILYWTYLQWSKEK